MLEKKLNDFWRKIILIEKNDYVAKRRQSIV